MDKPGLIPIPARPPFLEAAGYTIVAPGLFTPGSEDFTAQISEFKKQGCEVLTGATLQPRISPTSGSRACSRDSSPVRHGPCSRFPAATNAIGPTVYQLMGGGSWHTGWPFTASLTGRHAKNWPTTTREDRRQSMDPGYRRTSSLLGGRRPETSDRSRRQTDDPDCRHDLRRWRRSRAHRHASPWTRPRRPHRHPGAPQHPDASHDRAAVGEG